MTSPKPALILLAVLMLPATTVTAAEAPEPFASIGDLQLIAGETRLDVRVGYRTVGTLNDERSNVIVFPTWHGGTTADLLCWVKIGPEKLADSGHMGSSCEGWKVEALVNAFLLR
jgi:homoserine O-acetyltransferase